VLPLEELVEETKANPLVDLCVAPNVLPLEELVEETQANPLVDLCVADLTSL